MSRSLEFYWILTAATLGVYLVMVLWTLPYIAQEANGARPFDLRPLGYSFDEARDFLSALSEQGRVFYLTVQHRLDIVYPVLMALWVTLTVRALTPTWSRVVHFGIALLAAASAIFDYVENARVAVLLSGAAVTEDLVSAASQATVLKSAFGGALLCLTLVLLVLAAWRRVASGRFR